MASACLLRSVDILHESVRDGSGKGVGDHRDVTVHWDMLFPLLTKRGRGEGEEKCFPFILAQLDC